MKKIIDAGALRSPELSYFLAASPTNMAVICDYASMESFKGDGEINIRNSLRILSGHTRQVIILKSTSQITLLKAHSGGLHKRFTDYKQTEDFPAYCRAIFNGAVDPSRLTADIKRKEVRSNTHFQKLQENAENIRNGLTTLFQSYPPDDLRCLRAGKSVSEAFSNRVVNDIVGVTNALFRDSLKEEEFPTPPDALFSFQFRYALCSYALALNWAAKGGFETVAAAKLRNDYVDMIYAAYATFFDGLISKDNKLLEIYRMALWLLKNIFHI